MVQAPGFLPPPCSPQPRVRAKNTTRRVSRAYDHVMQYELLNAIMVTVRGITSPIHHRGRRWGAR